MDQDLVPITKRDPKPVMIEYKNGRYADRLSGTTLTTLSMTNIMPPTVALRKQRSVTKYY